MIQQKQIDVNSPEWCIYQLKILNKDIKALVCILDHVKISLTHILVVFK